MSEVGHPSGAGCDPAQQQQQQQQQLLGASMGGGGGALPHSRTASHVSAARSMLSFREEDMLSISQRMAATEGAPAAGSAAGAADAHAVAAARTESAVNLPAAAAATVASVSGAQTPAGSPPRSETSADPAAVAAAVARAFTASAADGEAAVDAAPGEAGAALPPPAAAVVDADASSGEADLGSPAADTPPPPPPPGARGDSPIRDELDLAVLGATVVSGVAASAVSMAVVSEPAAAPPATEQHDDDARVTSASPDVTALTDGDGDDEEAPVSVAASATAAVAPPVNDSASTVMSQTQRTAPGGGEAEEEGVVVPVATAAATTTAPAAAASLTDVSASTTTAQPAPGDTGVAGGSGAVGSAQGVFPAADASTSGAGGVFPATTNEGLLLQKLRELEARCATLEDERLNQQFAAAAAAAAQSTAARAAADLQLPDFMAAMDLRRKSSHLSDAVLSKATVPAPMADVSEADVTLRQQTIPLGGVPGAPPAATAAPPAPAVTATPLQAPMSVVSMRSASVSEARSVACDSVPPGGAGAAAAATAGMSRTMSDEELRQHFRDALRARCAAGDDALPVLRVDISGDPAPAQPAKVSPKASGVRWSSSQLLNPASAHSVSGASDAAATARKRSSLYAMSLADTDIPANTNDDSFVTLLDEMIKEEIQRRMEGSGRGGAPGGTPLTSTPGGDGEGDADGAVDPTAPAFEEAALPAAAPASPSSTSPLRQIPPMLDATGRARNVPKDELFGTLSALMSETERGSPRRGGAASSPHRWLAQRLQCGAAHGASSERGASHSPDHAGAVHLQQARGGVSAGYSTGLASTRPSTTPVMGGGAAPGMGPPPSCIVAPALPPPSFPPVWGPGAAAVMAAAAEQQQQDASCLPASLLDLIGKVKQRPRAGLDTRDHAAGGRAFASASPLSHCGAPPLPASTVTGTIGGHAQSAGELRSRLEAVLSKGLPVEDVAVAGGVGVGRRVPDDAAAGATGRDTPDRIPAVPAVTPVDAGGGSGRPSFAGGGGGGGGAPNELAFSTSADKIASILDGFAGVLPPDVNGKSPADLAELAVALYGRLEDAQSAIVQAAGVGYDEALRHSRVSFAGALREEAGDAGGGPSPSVHVSHPHAHASSQPQLHPSAASFGTAGQLHAAHRPRDIAERHARKALQQHSVSHVAVDTSRPLAYPLSPWRGRATTSTVTPSHIAAGAAQAAPAGPLFLSTNASLAASYALAQQWRPMEGLGQSAGAPASRGYVLPCSGVALDSPSLNLSYPKRV